MTTATATPTHELAAPAPTTVRATISDVPTFVAGLRSVVDAASRDAARAILENVRISRGEEPGTVRMVATDSYRLHEAIVPVGDEIAELFAAPAMLSGADLAPVIKMLTGPAYRPRRNKVAGTAVLEVTGLASTTSRIFTFDTHTQTAAAREAFGDFPNVDNLLFDPEQGVAGFAAFDPSRLASLLKAAAYVADGGPVRFHGHSPWGSSSAPELRPGLWTAASGDGVTFRGLLMPVRVP